MKLEAISFSELAKQSMNNYKNVIIAARRARYIISDRAAARQPFEDIADEEFPYSEESMESDQHYVELEKPIIVSAKELINNELEWKETQMTEQTLFK